VIKEQSIRSRLKTLESRPRDFKGSTVLTVAAFVLMLLFLAGCTGIEEREEVVAASPNFVIIFLDDSGWSDYRPFGDPEYPTPNVDRLASQGTSYYNFYVPQAVCSASRASLMTGSFPGRTKVFGAHGPFARGLEPQFATMGEVLKAKGYATAIFGKWHLGDQEDTRPSARGFDESAGLMYSNDMWKYHPENPEYWGKHPIQYWENGKVTIEDVTKEHQTMLTTWYTEKAVDFIQRHPEDPFLLYVPHSMPHVPIFCSEKFDGKSGKGLYADVMMEIDWSVGEILKALESAGISENTLVIMTSDNGPWVSYGNHAGVTKFREAKATGFDGGIRSSCIIKYPGHIEAGVKSERAFCSIDLLPTIAYLAEAPLPANPIDGVNLWDFISGDSEALNTQVYYPFSTGRIFEGIISGDGRWKLHLPHSYRTLEEPGIDGQAGKYRQETIELSLFDMEKDPLETTNALDDNPEITAKLQTLAEKHKELYYPDQ